MADQPFLTVNRLRRRAQFGSRSRLAGRPGHTAAQGLTDEILACVRYRANEFHAIALVRSATHIHKILVP